MAAVLGLSSGRYYTVKTIKALELVFSLSSTLDYSVSMDTWLQFPLQSANEKKGSRSIALLWRLYPSRRCFIFVSSSSSLQRCSTSLVVFFIWDLTELLLLTLVSALHCHTQSVSEVLVKMRQDCIAVSPLHRQQVSLWRKLRLKPSIWSFSSRRKLCVHSASSIVAFNASRDQLKAKQTHA